MCLGTTELRPHHARCTRFLSQTSTQCQPWGQLCWMGETQTLPLFLGAASPAREMPPHSK